jgi:hypothetical protein
VSTLTPREQALYDLAKGSLPRIVVDADDATQLEMLAGFATQFSLIWDTLEGRILETYMAQAGTEALDEHARDRGTRRQGSETDSALIYRLRYMEDSVTLSALTTKVEDIMTTYGVTVGSGYPAFVELRQDRGIYWEHGRVISCESGADIADGALITIENNATAELLEVPFDKNGSDPDPAIDITNGMTPSQVSQAALDVLAPYEDQLGVQVSRSGADLFIFQKYEAEPITVTTDASIGANQEWGTGAFFGRGYRMTGPGRQGTTLVCMLPYSATEACEKTVREALRMSKAGGVGLVVERRTSP